MAKNFFRPYNVTIKAGALTALNVRGSYFRIYSASESLIITGTNNDKGELLDASAGIPAGVELGPFNPPFQSLQIGTLSGGAGSAVIWISDVPTNVTTVAGTVNIIDKTSARSVAATGRGYSANIDVTGGATTYAHKRFRNPSTSVKKAIFSALELGLPTGATQQYGVWNLLAVGADLGTVDAGAAHPRLSPSGAPSASVLIISHEGTAGGPPAGSFSFQPTIPAGGNYSADMDNYSFCIMPGDALDIWLAAANQQMIGGAGWDEWGLTEI